MELRQLEYFQAVCETGNVTKAAENLHVAQPSVTVAIRKLEDELGLQLFDRTGRRLTPTSGGRIFRARVEGIRKLLADSITELNDFKQTGRGLIKMGVPAMIGAFVFPPIFATFKKNFPEIALSIVEEGSLSIQRRLANGELDLGIMVASEDLPAGLSTLPITTGQIVLCLPRDHHLGAFAKVPFAELEGQPFILFKEDTYSRRMVLEECRRHRFEPDIVLTSGQIETVLGLVERGVGVSFLLEPIAKKDPSILSRPLVDPLRMTIELAWNHERYVSRAAQAMIDFISDSSTFGR